MTAKPTAKERVLAVYPNARCTYHGSDCGYFVDDLATRKQRNCQSLGLGDTEAEAWRHAARRIKEGQ